MKISGLTLALMGLATACSSSSGPAAAGGATDGGTGGTVAGSTSGGAGAGGTGIGGASSAGTGGATVTGGSGGSSGNGGAASCIKCPTACCDAGATCVDDGLGNLSCRQNCTTSSECPASAACCEPIKGGTSVCEAATDATQTCRCTTGAECSSKTCAPDIDADGNPIGPYICVPNDGAAYHGCSGLTSCKGTDCCFIDAQANQFCVAPCLNDSQCGDAACVTYPSKASTCSGMMGCGPQ